MLRSLVGSEMCIRDRCIQNDLLLAMNQQKLTALVLLDLSAAFDTIDHNILLSRLSSHYGLTGTVIQLLSSYLQSRTQSVKINSHKTCPSLVSTGVPQGSVLGPLLFSLYTSPLSQLFSNTPTSFHLYDDDKEAYISFTAANSAPSLDTLSCTLDNVHTWLTSNRLTVNPSKTEFLLIGSHQQRAKLTSPTITFQNASISPSPSACNLCFQLDSSLTL